MIDAPRWTREVVGPIEERGGLAAILLTHRDDVADAERYAERFGARVWIHDDDAMAAPYATDLIAGHEPVGLDLDLGVTAVPVPGHTAGSVLYHVDGHVLFSGDSLAWDPGRERLMAFRRACWYSWEAQTASLERVARSGLYFDRLLCGHGWSHDLAGGFGDHLRELVARMPQQ